MILSFEMCEAKSVCLDCAVGLSAPLDFLHSQKHFAPLILKIVAHPSLFNVLYSQGYLCKLLEASSLSDIIQFAYRHSPSIYSSDFAAGLESDDPKCSLYQQMLS